jgi:hypothetical protein
MGRILNRCFATRKCLRYRIQRLSQAAVLAAVTLCLTSPVNASLSEADRNTLSEHLPIITECQGWPDSWDQCTGILANPTYEAADFEEFFNEYFVDHVLTWCLLSYYEYSAFWWHSQEVHETLQDAWSSVFFDLVDSTIADYGSALGSAFAADPDLAANCTLGMAFIHAIQTHQHSLASPEEKGEIDDQIQNWISSGVPELLRKSVLIDPEVDPFVNVFRAQLYTDLIDAYEISPDRRAELAAAIGITGDYLNLWDRHRLLILDDNKFDLENLSFLDSLFTVIDTTLTTLRIMTCQDYWYSGSQERLYFRSNSAVNVWHWQVGPPNYNPFPGDIDPAFTDGSEVVTHETAHNIDASYVYPNDRLEEWRERLIEEAGYDHMNYLRSMIPDSFFVQAPQEFLHRSPTSGSATRNIP